MNIPQLKFLTWLAALAVGGTLAYEVWSFFERRPELEKYQADNETIQRVLGDEIEEPEPIRPSVVHADQIKVIFHDMDWTGKPPRRVEVVERPPEVNTGPPRTPVSDLLEVLAVSVDGYDETGSFAYVLYIDKQLAARHNEPKERILRVGQKLTGKYAHVKVEAIRVEGVEFSFDDPEREHEVVSPIPWQPSIPGIVKVDPDAVQLVPRSKLIPTAGDYVAPRPRRNEEVRPSEFQVGTDTAREIGENYSLILSRDLQYRTARDPRNGSVKGLQITKVAPNSIPAEYGIQEGEILKSINGHKVKSVNEAVAFVKQEAATTDTWVAVFEKQGVEFTRTYRSPQD